MKIYTGKLKAELSKIIPRPRISFDLSDRQDHARDKSFHKESFPDVVIWPETTLEVSKVLKLVNGLHIPVTAWGGGSSLEGNCIPVLGGIVLDMKRMDRVLAVYQDDFQVRVQPGMVADNLNKYLAPYNLFFPAAPFSSYIATIGGLIANNAGGMQAVKYGVVGDNVLELEIVLSDGRIIKTGGRSIKTKSGYDLKHLFIGAEGTLGIITEAVLKLKPIPGAKMAYLLVYASVSQAVSTALSILHSSVVPEVIELMDEEYVALVKKSSTLAIPHGAALIIELAGEGKVIRQEGKVIEKICQANKPIFMEVAQSPGKQKEYWQARSSVRKALLSLFPGTGILLADIGLPISQIPNFVEKIKSLSTASKRTIVSFGHAGDGNLHVWIPYDLASSASLDEAKKMNYTIVKYALSLSGTATAEHGVGIGKQKYLASEHPTSLPLMKSIKKLLDPKGILNPGKMFSS